MWIYKAAFGWILICTQSAHCSEGLGRTGGGLDKQSPGLKQLVLKHRTPQVCSQNHWRPSGIQGPGVGQVCGGKQHASLDVNFGDF